MKRKEKSAPVKQKEKPIPVYVWIVTSQAQPDEKVEGLNGRFEDAFHRRKAAMLFVKDTIKKLIEKEKAEFQKPEDTLTETDYKDVFDVFRVRVK